MKYMRRRQNDCTNMDETYENGLAFNPASRQSDTHPEATVEQLATSCKRQWTSLFRSRTY